MSVLYDAIHHANAQARLGLILYTIPGYPTPALSQEIQQLLVSEPAVSIIETTLPVTGSFSEHTNDCIAAAHRLATSTSQPWQETLNILPTTKPLLCVLYRASVEAIGWSTLLPALAGTVAGILPEWHEPHPAPYASSAQQQHIEFVTCVGPWMPAPVIASQLAYAAPEQPLVYLMSAAMTGAPLYPVADLERTIGTIRRYRPSAKIAAGFGVRAAADIRSLGTVSGLDAVIIGTAWLAQMRQGYKAAWTYLQEVKGALPYV